MMNYKGKGCLIEGCQSNAVAGGIGLCRNCWNEQIERNITAFVHETKTKRV